MNKKLVLPFLFFLIISNIAFTQTTVKEEYVKALETWDAKKTDEAYKLFKDLLAKLKTTDTLYEATAYYRMATATKMENIARMKEDFSNSLNYGLETLELIQKTKDLFEESAEREVWMTKNIIVSYNGLGEIEKAKPYKEFLYKKYADKTLPKGIETYFNFDFFKLGDKNIWGYEWFEDLPENRFSKSFTKVVYYVYSTNADGSDKDQLCRYHVLMYHQSEKNPPFDYLLEKQFESDNKTISGSYYKYVYKKDIDYIKLKQDVKEIESNQITPNSKRITPH